MKKIILAIFALMAIVSCINNNSTNNNNSSTAETKSTESNIVEVLYLSGKQHCVTCEAIETQAQEAVQELSNDNVVMRTIDLSTPEGNRMAEKYEVTNTSLIVTKGDNSSNLTTIGFQYAKNNPIIFKRSIKSTIQNMID